MKEFYKQTNKMTITTTNAAGTSYDMDEYRRGDDGLASNKVSKIHQLSCLLLAGWLNVYLVVIVPLTPCHVVDDVVDAMKVILYNHCGLFTSTDMKLL